MDWDDMSSIGNQLNSSVPRIFKLLVLGSWIGVFSGLMTSIDGTPPIARFLNPDYWWLIKAGTAALLAYALTTYHTIPQNMGMGALAGLIQVGLLVLPIIYLPSALSSELSVAAFEKRSLIKSFGAGSDYSEWQSNVPNRSPGRKNRIVSLLLLALQPKSYTGERVAIEGIVYRHESLGEERFFCYRLLMWCCAADARPIGVLVEPNIPVLLRSGQWVRVEGTIAESRFRGRQIMMMKDSRVREIDPPQTPYLFY
jgi:uncharacterized repeat protein (TIGR03943 family)